MVMRSLARRLQFFNIKYTDYEVDVEERFPQQNKIELYALSRSSKVAISGSQRAYSTLWMSRTISCLPELTKV